MQPPPDPQVPPAPPHADPRMGWRRIAALASGLMLAGAFPGVGLSGLAWVAFIPLVLACRGLGARSAFGLGWISGTVFFLGGMYWLWRVTIPGLGALAAYCGLYTGSFSAFVALWDRRLTLRDGQTNAVFALCGAAMWTGLEMLRATLFTGFAWNALGVSQWENVALIQIAEYTGVAGVSFLVMTMNLALAGVMVRYHAWIRERVRVRFHPEVFAATVLLSLCLFFGLHQIRDGEPDGKVVSVVCIQPDISQYAKWDKAFEDEIRTRLDTLSRLALVVAKEPDLLLWPETALPDDLRYSQESREVVFDLASMGAPVLVGTMDFVRNVSSNGVIDADYFNSSILIDREGRLAGRYDKRHLVILGEYIPGWRWLPDWVSTISPLAVNLSAGSETGIFRQIEDAPFGVLICFEDTIAPLARASVRDGARWLVNQTNDGWFEPSRASWQHLAHGVFRSVENRVPTVRATNSGVTCNITPLGRVQDVLAEAKGSLDVRCTGFQPMRVTVPGGPTWSPTFYTRHGDVFGWLCATPAGIWLLLLITARYHRLC